ncbi:PREDICTED: VIP36-like protein [Pygoscelis adeliae]|uniref:VIP36-like protein n=1 Tax=Pygoscelis adeliae TaxID=9238 RepID=UPI0004F4FEB5|nr:PREDICTED: VIP36-like protein [Pygoscelis adeliae]
MGPVFGSKDNFLGLGVFVDTYPNEEKQQEAQKRRYSPGNQRVFPYISAMVNNGSLTYDHDRDGRPTELGGCTAMVRNLNHDTFLVIRYVKRRLTVLIDIDGKHEWRDCIDVPGVRLPRGYYFGTSSVTGDLSGTAPGSPALSPEQLWQLLRSFGCLEVQLGTRWGLTEAREDLSMLYTLLSCEREPWGFFFNLAATPEEPKARSGHVAPPSALSRQQFPLFLELRATAWAAVLALGEVLPSRRTLARRAKPIRPALVVPRPKRGVLVHWKARGGLNLDGVISPSRNPTADASTSPLRAPRSHGLHAGKSQPGFGALSSLGAHGLLFFLCHTVEAPLEPMSGLALFLIVFFSLVAIVFAIVIGVIVYNKWQEQSRKHFY